MLSNNQRRLISIGRMFSYSGELCCNCNYDLDTDTTDVNTRRLAGLRDWHWVDGKYYCQAKRSKNKIQENLFRLANVMRSRDPPNQQDTRMTLTNDTHK